MSSATDVTRIPVGVVELVDASGNTLLVIDGPNRLVTLPSGTGFTADSLDTTELALIDGAIAGTVVASKVVAVNSVKSVDVLQATTALSVGGTGVPGAALVQTTITKAMTAFSDTVAKAVFTVTVPNAAHAAVIIVDAVGILGAGGAIGAGEAARNSQYQVVLARTAGVAVVPALSAAVGGATATVAGGDNITSVVATLSAITGTVSATQTFTILFAITRSGAGATNHTGVFSARLLNNAASGVTIA